MELNNFKERISVFKKDVNTYIKSLETKAQEMELYQQTNEYTHNKSNEYTHNKPNEYTNNKTKNLNRSYKEYSPQRGKRSFHKIFYDEQAAGEKTPFKITNDKKWKNTLRKWYK